MEGEIVVSPIDELSVEIARLREKREANEDPEIKEAIGLKITALEIKLEKLKENHPEAVLSETEIKPPTEAQLQTADGYVRQARVEKMRGNMVRSTELLKLAVEAAPGAPSVLEALGDDLVERKLMKDARQMYQRALKLDPKNVGLETKYANVVLGTSLSMSVEEQLRLGMSDSLFLTSQDHVASASAATFLSLLLPGLGHIVLGKTLSGIAILSAWLACGFWLLFMAKDLRELAKTFQHGGGSFNPLVFAPLIVMAIIFIGTVNSLRIPKSGARSRSNRPAPPFDLPF